MLFPLIKEHKLYTIENKYWAWVALSVFLLWLMWEFLGDWQVLDEAEYEVWLKRHAFAETSIENREELLLDSAQRLEKNLTLLGEIIMGD